MSRIPTLTAAAQEPSGERFLRMQGRYAQTLNALVRAGELGLTSVETSDWGSRLSHYVLILRSKHCLQIETLWKPHKTPIGPCRLARYVLRSDVRIIESANILEAA